MTLLRKESIKEQIQLFRKNKIKTCAVLTIEALLFFSIFALVETKMAPNKSVAQGIKQADVTVKSSSGKYTGPIENGEYHGQGIFKHLNGAVYEGSFVRSQRSGSGKLTWKNGDVFSGTWTNDIMDEGTYTFKDGRVYKGKFDKNGLLQGNINLGPAAIKYGYVSFSADIKNGEIYAVCYKKNDGSTYNGLLNGYAEIRYPSGNTYVGNVVNGVRHGKGTFRWMYNNYQNTRSYYTGSWTNGDMNGEGTYHYNSSEYPCINGNFSNGKPNGRAVYYKSASNTFTTLWQNGTCVNNNI